MSAVLSPDGVHRYRLTRDFPAAGGDGRVLFIMLNPSTADASKDDATIRKCRGFATRWGFASLEVVNLFSFRSRHPSELWTSYSRNTEKSDDHIVDAVADARRIVVAWGHWPQADARASKVESLLRSCLVALGSSPVLWRIGGLTKDGYPRHPLMLSYSLLVAAVAVLMREAKRRVLIRG